MHCVTLARTQTEKHTNRSMKNKEGYDNSVTQSECPACYKGSAQHATFADCWTNNAPAHTFSGNITMESGSFKCCFLSILGASGEELQNIKRDINVYSPKLGTLDLVTAVEPGFDLKERVFNFSNFDQVTVLNDQWRKVLKGATGVADTDTDVHSQANFVCLDTVKEFEIRIFTKDTPVWIDCEHDIIIHNLKCMTVEDGGLDGMCKVRLTDPPLGMRMRNNDNVVIIPTTYLKADNSDHRHGSQPGPTWNSLAKISVLAENMVLSPDCTGEIPFTGDNPVDNISCIQKFDPHNTLTPKIFATFYKTMAEWNDDGQKEAIIDSLCVAHHNRPGSVLKQEVLDINHEVHFAWKTTGVQSVFQGKHGDEIWSYVRENTQNSQHVRLGKVLRDTKNEQHALEYIVVHWEDGTHQLLKPGDVTVLSEESEDYNAAGSRVVMAYDIGNVGTIDDVIINNSRLRKYCHVRFDNNPAVVVTVSSLLLTRLFLMRHVDIERGVMGRVVNSINSTHKLLPDNIGHTLLEFKGTPQEDRLGKVWVCSQKLSQDNIRHKIHTYLTCPRRSARFTVQERVGASISSLAHNKTGGLETNTPRACVALARAIAIFCRGVENMHSLGWSHNDAHSSNITLTGPTANGEFMLKLIDLDRLEKADSRRILNDCELVLDALLELIADTVCLCTQHRAFHEKFVNDMITDLTLIESSLRLNPASNALICVADTFEIFVADYKKKMLARKLPASFTISQPQNSMHVSSSSEDDDTASMDVS